MFNWSFALQILPVLAKAALVTIYATVIAFVIALFLGLILALCQRTPWRTLNILVREMVEFVRSTPLLIQIFFIFYAGPQIGITLSAWVAGLVALGVHYASYTSEVYRSGLENVASEQWEACVALNLSTLHTYKDVILPLAIPPIVPALGNYLVGMFKDTPMLSAIAIIELLGQAKLLASDHFRYTEPLTLVGVFFLIMSLAAAYLIVRPLEQYLTRLRQTGGPRSKNWA